MIAVGGLFYNAEPFLEVWFRKLLEQDYPKNKTRLILVYGKGEDQTLPLLERFAREHGHEYAELTLFEINRIPGALEEEAGYKLGQANVCKVYNHLIELSRPDDIIIMEQDIEAPPNAISRLLELKDEGADIAAGITLVTGGELRVESKNGSMFKVCGLPSISAYYLDKNKDFQAISVQLAKVTAIKLPKELVNKEIWLDGAATGLSLITRPLMNKLQFEVAAKRSQDLHYCARARELGFKLLVDTGLWYEHNHYQYRKELAEDGLHVTLLDTVKTDGITFKIEAAGVKP